MISILFLLPVYFIIIQAERGGVWRVLYLLWPFAWLLDVLCNAIEMTLVFAELPQEFTLSNRIKRLKLDPYWRGDVARYLARVLDAIAPSERHI